LVLERWVIGRLYATEGTKTAKYATHESLFERLLHRIPEAKDREVWRRTVEASFICMPVDKMFPRYRWVLSNAM
jgi:hypothetical protein